MDPTTGDPYRLHPRPPTPAAYERICRAVGWGQVMNFAAAPEALRRGLHAVTVEHLGEAVGMGRVVGDGAIYFYIQDVAVVPEHQGRGLGGRILQALLAHLHASAPERAFVGLFAAAGTEGFYRRHGFEAHAGLVGMFQVVPAAGRRAD